MDDWSAGNMAQLEAAANGFIAAQGALFEQVCPLLVTCVSRGAGTLSTPSQPHPPRRRPIPYVVPGHVAPGRL